MWGRRRALPCERFLLLFLLSSFSLLLLLPPHFSPLPLDMFPSPTALHMGMHFTTTVCLATTSNDDLVRITPIEGER